MLDCGRKTDHLFKDRNMAKLHTDKVGAHVLGLGYKPKHYTHYMSFVTPTVSFDWEHL